MAKFNHQPFEDWLLSEEAHSADQEQALQSHLLSCEQCRQLSSAWNEVELELKNAPTLSPAPGFTVRWQANLASRRTHRENRQTLLFLSVCLVGAGLLLIALGILAWPLVRSPYPILLALAYQVTSVYMIADTAASLVVTLFRTVFGVVPPIFWVGLSVAAGSMLAVWIFTLRRLAYSRRIIQ